MNNHNLLQIKGGTNCSVYLYKFGGERSIIKICGENKLDRHIGRLVMSDYFRIKNKLSSLGIFVPITMNVYLTSENNADLVIIESYEGVSLREILVNKRVSKNRKTISVKKCLDFIDRLPENIPLDTNPGNFCFRKDASIAFVDFIPPDPWKYKDNINIQSRLKEIFPSMKSPFYKHKYLSYYKNKYRVERLSFHCRKLFGGIDKSL